MWDNADMRNKPEQPTTCNISDLLNKVYSFVENDPDWAMDDESVAKMMLAYSILRNISQPDMVTDEEFEFVMDIHAAIQDKINP